MLKLNIKKTTKKDENWVAKTLKKKQLYPFAITLLLCLVIFSIYSIQVIFEINELNEKNSSIQSSINNYKKTLMQIEEKISKNEEELNRLKVAGVDENELVTITTRVCDMLKAREAIGGYYIIKNLSKDFLNVVDLEVQISYGDKQLLQSMLNLVLSEVYHIKKAERTKLGVLFEVAKLEK